MASRAPLFLDFLVPALRQPSRPVTKILRPALRSRSHPSRSPQLCLFSSGARQNAIAIQNSRKDEHGNEMTINILPRAAHRLQTIAEKDQNPDLALRVSVESGGCHGFQYLMSLTTTKELNAEEDTLFEDEKAARETSTYKAKIVLDEASLELLKGSSIDYTMELIGSQFKVTGIPGATSSCGCGTSFDIAA